MNPRFFARCSLFAILAILAVQACSRIAPFGSAIRQGREVCAPVIGALEQYRRKTGSYPPTLETLVSQGFIARVPRLPTYLLAKQLGIEYQCDRALDSYDLRFAYDETDFGPGKILTAYYDSDHRDWTVTKYALSFHEIAATRAAMLYRAQREHRYLERYFFHATQEAKRLPWLTPWTRTQAERDLGPARRVADEGDPSRIIYAYDHTNPNGVLHVTYKKTTLRDSDADALEEVSGTRGNGRASTQSP